MKSYWGTRGIAMNAMKLGRYGFGAYVPDNLSRLTYLMSRGDQERAERLEDEVVALARKNDPSAPDPRVVLSRDIGDNAMDLPFNDTMYVGTDLLYDLSDADCRAVIAHELGHAVQKVRVAAIPAVKVACTVIVPAATLAAGIVTGFGLLIPAAAGICLAGHYVGRAASRSAEKHADLYAGKITGRPADLAHALSTILPEEAQPPRTFLGRIQVACQELNMDHPATYRRVEYLNKMQQKIDRRAGRPQLALA